MRKFFVIFFSFLLLSQFVFSASAKSPNANTEVPERSGDYQEPGNPNVRVRVFVHNPKEKVSLSEQAVCTSDDPSSAVVGKTGWKLPTTNWTYRLNTSSVPASVGGGNLSTITTNGFNSWTTSISSSSSKPVLVYGGTTTKTKSSYDGQNIIAWGRTSGSTLGVTYVRYYTSSGIVVDVDTIMNTRYLWTLNTCSSNAYDAADILVHELGHWFGLNDEYDQSYVNNTMYGYGSKAERKKITPEQGDIDGINLIY